MLVAGYAIKKNINKYYGKQNPSENSLTEQLLVKAWWNLIYNLRY